MQSEKSDTLQPISEDTSVEDGSRILFKNLESLGQLQRDKLLEIASNALGVEDIESRKDELTNDVVTLDELVKFIAKEPAIDIKALSTINANLVNQEEPKPMPQENNSPLSPEENKEEKNNDETAAPDSQIDELKAEIARLADRNGDFEIEMGALVSENRKLKEIITDCKRCYALWKGIRKEDSPEQEETAQGHEKKDDGENEKIAELTQRIKQLEDELSAVQDENQKLEQLLGETGEALEEQVKYSKGMEERLQQVLHMNKELENKLAESQENEQADLAGLQQRIDQLIAENEDLRAQIKPEASSEIEQLHKIIDELTEEKDILQLELDNYKRKEELADHETKQNKNAEEAAPKETEEAKQEKDEQIDRLQKENAGLTQELEAARVEIEKIKQLLEESESLSSQLQAKIQSLEQEKTNIGEQEKPNVGQPESSEVQIETESPKKQENAAEKESSAAVENFIARFNTVFQELAKTDYRVFLEVDEDPAKVQLLESPPEAKLARVRSVIFKFFELRNQFNLSINERDELIKRLNMARAEAANNQRLSPSGSEGKNQLLFELNEATAALEQRQEEIKEMTAYIKQLEYERNALYRRLDEQKLASKGQAQVFDMLDGTLQIAFTSEETRSMTVDQKLIEMQNIVRSYQGLREECRDLAEERDYLQVTLDSVTNKLKAQQSEIEFLNRQIDVMRNEVAALVKMDEFKSAEKMKSENIRLKQELEALRAEKEKFEKETSQDKANLEAAKAENKQISKDLAEVEEAREKLLKELKALSAQVGEKTTEIEALQKQVKDAKVQCEELARLLEFEREENRRKEHDLVELSHQVNEIASKMEKTNMLLEHERNESSKKERNLNDLIQQVSQLIQKNEKANELVLQEKEKTRKAEEALQEQQKKNNQLQNRVETLTEQLDEEKQRRKDQDRLIAEMRRELGYSAQDFERVKVQSYVHKTEINRDVQNRMDNVSSEVNAMMKLLGKDSSDSSTREEAISTLRNDFAALIEQNKKLSETIDALRSDPSNSQGPAHENSNKRLRDQGLAIPEKVYELSKPADQVEYLSKEFDKLEKERRRLAASLEAQKDDSTAKEYVISSLKNQNAVLAQSHEALSKLREDVFAKDGDKKDAARRLEALKTYFAKNPRLDRALNHEFTTAEQELIKQKDEQLFELHKKIQKLLGELRLRGWDLHQKDPMSDSKAQAQQRDGTSTQLSQMMEMMTNLVNARNEQSSIQEAHLEDENRRLRDKLARASNKIKALVEKLKKVIADNKALKQKLEKWLRSCIDGLETEVKLLRTGTGSIDQGKLGEFLHKISKNLSNAESNLVGFGAKEEQLKRELYTIAEETGETGLDDSDFMKESPKRGGKRHEGGFLEAISDDDSGGKNARAKERSKRTAQIISDDENSNESDEEFASALKKETAVSSSFFTAPPKQEKVKNTGLTDGGSLHSIPGLQPQYLTAEQLKQQQMTAQYLNQSQGGMHGPQSLSQQLTRQSGEPIPPHQFHSESFSQPNTQQSGYFNSPYHQRQGSGNFIPGMLQSNLGYQSGSLSAQRFGPVLEGGQGLNQPYLQTYHSDQPQNTQNYDSLGMDQDRPYWKSRVNSISDPQYMKDMPGEGNMGYRSPYRDNFGPDGSQSGGLEGQYYPSESKYYGREPPSKFGSAISSQGNLRDFLRKPDSNANRPMRGEGFARGKKNITVVDTSHSPGDDYGYDEPQGRNMRYRRDDSEEGNSHLLLLESSLTVHRKRALP